MTKFRDPFIGFPNVSSNVLVLAMLTAVLGGPCAHAQTLTTPLSSVPVANFDSYDEVEFQVQDGDPFAKGSLLWFPDDPAVIDWREVGSGGLQDVTFSAPGPLRKQVYMGVVNDTDDGFDPLEFKELIVEKLTLKNVDVDPKTIQLRLQGTSLSWTMENARYATIKKTPTFYAPAPLTMTAASGVSELYRWSGLIASPTALRVDPGATLAFRQVGSLVDPAPGKQLYFDHPNGNTADINNGTLQMDFAGVVFNTGMTPSVTGGVVTEGFVVRNGGLLALSGSEGSMASTAVDLRGSMLVDSSTLTLGARNLLTINNSLHLSDAMVSLAHDASIIVDDLTVLDGTNTISTTAPLAGVRTAGFRSALELFDSSAELNVTGSGDFYANTVVRMNGGMLNLEMDPGEGQFVIESGIITGGGEINIDPDNNLRISESTLNLDLDGGMAIHNEGYIRVSNLGKIQGPGTITGNGTVSVSEGSAIKVTQPSDSLEMSKLLLDYGSALILGIYPSGASRIEVGEILIASDAPPFAPVLELQVNGDAMRPTGEKLILVDYDTIGGSILAPRFRDMPDGHVFTLGLNTYRIQYEDAVYGATNGGNSSVISLTVVPDTHPIAGADTVVRFPSQSVKVSVATLLSNDVDPATGTNAGLSITAVSNPGGSPATVTLSGDTVFYDPKGHLTADTFEYTVQNSLGQTTTGTVTVSLIVDNEPSQNVINFTLLGDGSAETVFGGIPGRTYRIQTTEDLINWTDRATVVADGVGRVMFTDPPPLVPSRFYRTVSP